MSQPYRLFESSRYRFFAPVPDGPARFALFFAPLDRCPDVWPLERGAAVFEPFPRPPSSFLFATYAPRLQPSPASRRAGAPPDRRGDDYAMRCDAPHRMLTDSNSCWR